MKSSILTFCIFTFALLFSACTQKNAGEKSVQPAAAQKDYNPEFKKVLEAHGGIENWNDQQTLSFAMGKQKQTIDLHSREVKITSPTMSMGNDAGTVWIKQDTAAFEGSPTFYHSLMFYFHTMPFVLADDGINYEAVADKEIRGTTYKGLKMSFDDGVGDASKDDYIVYYHPDTHKMEWLAYTSTYQSQEKSDDFGLIHYKNWKDANGFLLPTELQWHAYKDGKVGEASGDPRMFSNVSVSEEEMADNFYAMPEGAEVDSAGRE
jgi:hypothetical protein